MGWCPDVPRRNGPHQGAQQVNGVICHRTYGAWAGDLAVGDGARAPVGFHFLVGRQEGQWAQFCESQMHCNHAAGGNSGTIGIEVTGTNDDPMTDWQIRALSHICQWICAEHDIPLVHAAGGRQGPFHGFKDHAQVAGSTHDDLWTSEDWKRIVAVAEADTSEDDMFSDTDRATVEDLRAQVAALDQRVPQVQSAVGYLLSSGTHHWAWTDDLGNLHRAVWRESGWDVETLASGCVPCQWAVMNDGTSGGSKFGRFFEVAALQPDGSMARAVWTPTDGWRPAERIAA